MTLQACLCGPPQQPLIGRAGGCVFVERQECLLGYRIQPLLGLLLASAATFLFRLASAWRVGTLSIVLVEAYAGATSVHRWEQPFQPQAGW